MTHETRGVGTLVEGVGVIEDSNLDGIRHRGVLF